MLVGGIGVWKLWPALQPYLQKYLPSFGESETVDRTFHGVLIRVTTVTKGPIRHRITVNGTVKALDAVPIMSQIAGQVKSIHFHQGEMVKKNDLLIQLDDAKALADLQEAESQLKLAEANYKRQQLLLAQRASSVAIMEKALAELAVARANVEKARLQRLYTQIKAPFEGEIGLISLSVGSQITPNQEITRLVRPDPLEVEFQIPESEIAHVRKGQDLSILVEGFDTLPFIGKITAIEPYSDPVAHTIRARGLFENTEGKIKDGAFARVTLSLAQEEDATLVPTEAVIQEGEDTIVFVVEGGRVHRRIVTLGARERDMVQILQGVVPGEVIAIEPVESLKDNLPVQIEASE